MWSKQRDYKQQEKKVTCKNIQTVIVESKIKYYF